MTIEYDFNTAPVFPREIREFTLLNGGPGTISIKCYVQKPPPPSYRECDECGTYNITDGHSISIVASFGIFSRASGRLVIELEMQSGESEIITLQSYSEYDRSGGKAASA